MIDYLIDMAGLPAHEGNVRSPICEGRDLAAHLEGRFGRSVEALEADGGARWREDRPRQGGAAGF